jgi:hypothetical protein
MPSFTFEVSGAVQVACSISDSAFSSTACSSPYQPSSNLGDGPHTLTVEATDEFGNSSTATRDFTVDTSAPHSTIDSGPSGTIDTNTPTITFSSDDPSASFGCRFDDGDFFVCTSPLVPSPPLQNGEHTFEVVATDQAGNFDQTPQKITFTVFVPGAAPPPPPNGTTTQVGSSNVIIGSLVLISGRTVKLVKHRLVPVSLTCAGRRKCDGKVTITTNKPVKTVKKVKRHGKKIKKVRRRIAKLGSKHFSIEGNRKVKVLVRLSKSNARLLRRLKRVVARATIREIDVHGLPRVSMRTFTLRAR